MVRAYPHTCRERFCWGEAPGALLSHLIPPSCLAVYYSFGLFWVKIFCHFIRETSHWFEQQDVQKFERSESKVLLWSLDAGTAQESLKGDTYPSPLHARWNDKGRGEQSPHCHGAAIEKDGRAVDIRRIVTGQEDCHFAHICWYA